MFVDSTGSCDACNRHPNGTYDAEGRGLEADGCTQHAPRVPGEITAATSFANQSIKRFMRICMACAAPIPVPWYRSLCGVCRRNGEVVS